MSSITIFSLLDMFTGIIEETGIIKRLRQKKNLCMFEVQAKKTIDGTKIGGSIAIDGVCLTVTDIKREHLAFDVMKETLRITTLSAKKSGERVNLERALQATGRIEGHFVTGHVDDVGEIKAIAKARNYIAMQVSFDKKLARYIVPKGSICLDGISLTVGRTGKDYFSVYLIPYTMRLTNLQFKRKGDKVNLETDVLAKYILGTK